MTKRLRLPLGLCMPHLRVTIVQQDPTHPRLGSSTCKPEIGLSCRILTGFPVWAGAHVGSDTVLQGCLQCQQRTSRTSDWTGKTLRLCDWTGKTLKLCDWTGKTLRLCDWTGKTLRLCDWMGKTMRLCDWTGKNLRLCDWTG
ncbi:hypothetical protein UPYG_G00162130 [Umbra pygmaea]|uniref:Uncharacterized protein n=1 Tax=Umbra pygmaea TaxID=75934 RepID=A0ABD0WLU1_UMBPY